MKSSGDFSREAFLCSSQCIHGRVCFSLDLQYKRLFTLMVFCVCDLLWSSGFVWENVVQFKYLLMTGMTLSSTAQTYYVGNCGICCEWIGFYCLYFKDLSIFTFYSHLFVNL